MYWQPRSLGCKSCLSVSFSEAEVHGREFVKSLLARGLHGVALICSDAHAGMAEAHKACFAGARWQRWQFHLKQNALQYVPTQEDTRQVMEDLKGVFDAADGEAASERLSRMVRKYQKSAPKLADGRKDSARADSVPFAKCPSQATAKRIHRGRHWVSGISRSRVCASGAFASRLTTGNHIRPAISRFDESQRPFHRQGTLARCDRDTTCN